MGVDRPDRTNNTLSHLVFGCLGMEHHHVLSKGIASTQTVVFFPLSYWFNGDVPPQN